MKTQNGLASAVLIVGVVAAAVVIVQTPATVADLGQWLPANGGSPTVYGTGDPQNIENGECTPLMVNGDPANKADVVLIGKDYESENVMRSDFTYFMDFDGDNRGLFAIPPFDDHRDAFNVWTINAGDGIGDYGDSRTGRGLIKDATDWFPKCPYADYRAVLAKGGMGRSAFALQGHRLFVKDVHRKVQNRQGAAGFLHEWGHAFGGLKDEYYRDGGRNAAGKPNCADTRSQAEDWWGEMAEQYADVGYYQGCAYTADNWRPHKKSIMGNGGLHSYGRVNEKRLEHVLSQYE